MSASVLIAPPKPDAIPFRDPNFLPVDLAVERRSDGVVMLRSRFPLGECEPNLPRVFAQTAERCGDQSAIAMRGDDGEWVHKSYAALKRDIDAVTQWLIDHVERGRSMLVMTGNDLPAATLILATYAAGVVHCPVGPAYGLAGGDYGRLRHVFDKVKPAAVYVDAHPALVAAIQAVAGDDVVIVTPNPALFDRPATGWADIAATERTLAVDQAIDAVDPDAVAIYMLTSGSTGLPKIVPQSLASVAVVSKQYKMTIGNDVGSGAVLDWLPWHHASGAGMLRMTLLRGGTFYVDTGKPVPGLFDQTIRNLREVPVGFFMNVPLGYAMIVEAMENDPLLRRTFFSNLTLMIYGGAGLPQPVYDRLQQFAVEETGQRIHMATGYGMTETVAGCMLIHFPTDRVGIGLPAPGAEVKLVPSNGRYEVRLRGPMVMRGYLNDPAKNAEVFDEEGFYKTGDLAVFHDPAEPELGLAFAGRQAEEFKLSNGTWVYGGQLREKLLKALDPLVAELVLCDDGRDYLTMLAWPAPGADADALGSIVACLRTFNLGQRGGAATVRRVRLLASPPDPNVQEVSDKGSINRRAVLDNRRDDLSALYAEPPGADVGVVPP